MQHKMRIVFMGSPAFAERSLRALGAAGFTLVGVVSQPARPAGRGQRSVQPPVAEWAISHGIPLIQPERPHVPETLETLRRWAPDVIVVAAYGHILRPVILNLPPAGCVNVHASLLPKYRGASPIPMALLAGETGTGVSIMLLDEGMDSGPILAQRALPILDSDTAGTLTEKLASLGAELLVEVLPAWVRGQIIPQPQDHARATYCRPLRKEDGRLDWGLPARELWLRVRAFDPWPGTYTLWRGQILKILEVQPAQGVGEKQPGLVTSDDNGPLVTTGDGRLLRLQRLQLTGRRPLDGPAFVRGQQGFVGSILGETS